MRLHDEIRVLVMFLLSLGAGACATERAREAKTDSSAPPRYASVETAAAVAQATARLAEHGQNGFSLADLERTRDWFTPELYALLAHDMGGPGGPGYLNADPFLDAQDNVGPSRFENVRQAGDSVMVMFSHESWPPGHRDLRHAARRRCMANRRLHLPGLLRVLSRSGGCDEAVRDSCGEQATGHARLQRLTG